MERKFTLIALLSVVLTLVIFVVFYGKFSSALSNGDISEWGDFADIVAGITGPILGIVNLIILIRLTLAISQVDDKRMLTEIRHAEYKDCAAKLFEVDVQVFTRTSALPLGNQLQEEQQKLSHLSKYLDGIRLDNRFLFNSYERDGYLKMSNPIIIHLDEMAQRIQELVPYFPLKTSEANNQIPRDISIKIDSLIEAYNIFEVFRKDMLVFLQSSVIHHKVPKTFTSYFNRSASSGNLSQMNRV